MICRPIHLCVVCSSVTRLMTLIQRNYTKNFKKSRSNFFFRIRMEMSTPVLCTQLGKMSFCDSAYPTDLCVTPFRCVSVAVYTNPLVQTQSLHRYQTAWSHKYTSLYFNTCSLAECFPVKPLFMLLL
jgi:hypothetical protein